MKSPTKRIFYHLEVTRGTFDTEMPIRARLHTLPARRSNHPRTPAHVTSTSQRLRPHRITQKSLVAERYQAFSEAKCLS